MARVVDLTRDVIEPAAGAAARVGAGERRTDERRGVHQLWASDEYRNVWWCVPLDALGHSGVRDAASIDIARALLRRIKAHADPVLKHYGWTVKHLHEHVGGPGGMCYHDMAGTADISLQLRSLPSKECNTFRPFARLMRVMLHEMTHIHGLGVEDIHPPEFYEKMREVVGTYHELLANGAIVEPDGGGGDGAPLAEVVHGEVPEGGCRRGRLGERGRGRRGRGGAAGARGGGGGGSGAGRGGAGSARAGSTKRPALGKRRAMIDRRTSEGKRMAAEQAASTPAEAARSAALARFGLAPLSAAERRTQAMRAPGAGTSAQGAIVLTDDEDDAAAEAVGAVGAVGAVDDGGETEVDEEEADEEDVEEELGVHDGPPGLCACGVCARVAQAFRGGGGSS